MLFIYPAIIHKEDDNTFWSEFPDLPGCQSSGDTLQEIIEGSNEALALYLSYRIEHNMSFDKASEIKDLSTDSSSFTTYISTDIKAYSHSKAVKKTLTIPEWLNDRATAMNINFSQVLQDALIEQIQKSKKY